MHFLLRGLGLIFVKHSALEMCLISDNCYFPWCYYYYYYWHLPKYRFRMLFLLAELTIKSVRETTPCLGAHVSMLPILVLSPGYEDEKGFPFLDFCGLWKMSWLPHPVFRVTKQAFSHDDFFFTGGRVAVETLSLRLWRLIGLKVQKKNSVLICPFVCVCAGS